jgi:hypothetical protein
MYGFHERFTEERARLSYQPRCLYPSPDHFLKWTQTLVIGYKDSEI